ncbi:MAG: type I restriction enzyme HsdR N-terminal domain-containing protein [Peptostreptococcaceae bacterium]|nr:type I restriction enzyme HsdR N-terminal domain-containing protein [Peptostreptococcaceae bacterium]
MSINVPSKISERIGSGAKKFKPILEKAKSKDINESDTVTIIVDMLCDIFGYDKYTEITSEHAVKKTFCDLAIKIDGIVRLLIEVKAAGLDLKEQHIKQAVDYGSNTGVDWVVLTNGTIWKVYKIVYSKPIDTELVYEIDMSQLNLKRQSEIEMIYYLTKEAMAKNSKATLDDYLAQKQILNKFMLGQILLTDSVLDVVRKTIKKISPDAKVSNEEIKQIIAEEIIKREVLDDEKAADCFKKVAKANKPATKVITKNE